MMPPMQKDLATMNLAPYCARANQLMNGEVCKRDLNNNHTFKLTMQNESSLTNESTFNHSNSSMRPPDENEKVKDDELRVVILTESFHPYTSGIARRFKEIIERLAQRGYRIHVITGCKNCETWTSKQELKERVTFSSLRAIEFKNQIDCALPFLIPQYAIIKEIVRFDPHVIHCVEHTPASTFGGAIAKTLSIPIVWSSHTNLDFYIPLYIHPFMAPVSLRVYQQLRRTFLNLADYNLSVSSDFVRILNSNGISEKVHVWKTGVDADSFHPKYRSHEMRLKMFNGHYAQDKVLLVSVGRISPEKNFEFLVDVLERFPQTFLCIVGDGPYKDRLVDIFPSDRCHFIGFLQGEQLASAYASADFFIYASVSETFGQVYLEAMSSGTPIVAAEGKQMKEFFVNGVHGHTWIPGDIESASTALSLALTHRDELSQNCRSNALNHSWNSAANQISDVYSMFRVRKSTKTKRTFLSTWSNLAITIARGFYYMLKWLYLIILVLLLMAPFMKVANPANTSNSSTSNNNERRQESFREQQVHENSNGDANENTKSKKKYL